LLEEPTVEVQFIFVYEPLAAMLLEHARAIGEPPGLVAWASEVLHQPSSAAPHDDHFHVRIFCPIDDRVLGCADSGALRWKKKDYKYEPRELARRRARPTADGAAVVSAAIGRGTAWALGRGLVDLPLRLLSVTR
jgi:hypothetical protein